MRGAIAWVPYTVRTRQISSGLYLCRVESPGFPPAEAVNPKRALAAACAMSIWGAILSLYCMREGKA